MAEKKKLTLKENLLIWAGAIGIVGGLFFFCIICGVVFMDYDPMNMVNGIKSDFMEIVEKISNLWG